MTLQSQLFRGDAKLEAAAVSDPAHILQGARGPHVVKIQQALIQLDRAGIAPDGIYGPKTGAAVRAFKQRRQILNTQGQLDDIVGKKTTAALDGEMFAKEKGGGGGGSRGRLGFGIVGDIPGTPSTPLVVVPFNPGPTQFVLAEEFDDPNSEDLTFADPPFPPQTLAQKAITDLMETGEFLTPLIPPVAKRETLMRGELAVAGSLAGARSDALVLVELFFKNPFAASAASFGKIFDVGSALSNSVRNSDEFKKEHEGVRSDIDNALKRQFVNGIIDVNKLRGVPQSNAKFKVPGFVGNPNGVKEPARVGFGASTSFGLLALIGDFQGCKVVLKSFDVDQSKNTYRATLRYEFVEHFGLDNSDVNPASSFGHGTPGQVAFWLLQHKSRPGHFPFRYLVIVEQDITGSLDPSLSNPPGRGPSR
jgi:peptidoglycan hydrolase-like protein with peptidoglycan-binding domain